MTTAQHKRLVVLADGTWQARDTVTKSKWINGHLTPVWDQIWFTNVAMLSQCITNHAIDSSGNLIPQITFYQEGIGATPYLAQKAFEGATGTSLDEKVKEAYAFLVDNYEPGDKIFIFGFSRGAYVSRTLAAFINFIGIISRKECGLYLQILYQAFNRRLPADLGTVQEAEKVVVSTLNRWPSRNTMYYARDLTEKYNESRSSLDKVYDFFTHSRVDKDHEEKVKVVINSDQAIVPPPIEVVGVWDTVGALGIPGLFSNPQKRQYHSFFDPMLAPNIRHAFHALALDEDRQDFAPTLWYLPAEEHPLDAKMREGQVLEQMWGLGTHSDCGGGHSWHGLSDIMLAWMISKLMDGEVPLLNIDIDLAKRLQDHRLPWTAQPSHGVRPPIMFQKTRLVKEWLFPKYVAYKKQVNKESTNERIHHSVTFANRHDPSSSPQFEGLRKHNLKKLKKMWNSASQEDSMGKTEKFLRWNDEDIKKALNGGSLENHSVRLVHGKVPRNDPQLVPFRPLLVPKFVWSMFIKTAYVPSRTIDNLLNLKVVLKTFKPVPSNNLTPPLLLSFMKRFDPRRENPTNSQVISSAGLR